MTVPEPDGARARRGKLSIFYNDTAEAYEELWAPELLPLSRKLLPHLPLASARAVLDAAAGVGTLLPELIEQAPGALVIANDLTPGMVSRATAATARVAGDAARLPFKDAGFDVGILAFALFHLFDPRLGLEEIARVLRPGGVVGTITWGDENDPVAYQVWEEEMEAGGAPPAVDAGLANHELLDTPAKMESLMRSAGLDPVGSWVGEYRGTPAPEEFLERRTRFGQARWRLDQMTPENRAGCLERAQARLAALPPQDFLEVSEVVYAVGRKP